MGKKGGKMTSLSEEKHTYLMDKFIEVDGVTTKKMFGGFGIFYDSKMFGMIDSKANVFFKVDDSNLADYEERSADRHSKMPYYSVPDEVIDDPMQLAKWANKSIMITKK